MNSKELRIYTLLTHPVSPESYYVGDDGSSLYVMESGVMVRLEGENLNKLTPMELYRWYLPAIRQWKIENRM